MLANQSGQLEIRQRLKVRGTFCDGPVRQVLSVHRRFIVDSIKDPELGRVSRCGVPAHRAQRVHPNKQIHKNLSKKNSLGTTNNGIDCDGFIYGVTYDIQWGLPEVPARFLASLPAKVQFSSSLVSFARISS